MFNKLRSFLFNYRAIKWAKNEYFFLINKNYTKYNNKLTDFTSVIHINTSDNGGGAAKIAHDLFSMQQKNGFKSKMLVAKKNTENQFIYEIKKSTSRKQHFLEFAKKKMQWQDFFHESSFEILNSEIFKESDIVHLHNLHINYFSLLAIPSFSESKPIVWSLHDMHSITGHCAHSFNCEKWQNGCGNCPQLDSYPALSIDTTDWIWKTKQKIYEKSNLNIVVLSDWLRKKVEKSILSNQKITTIYNGVNTTIYKKSNKKEVRKKLGIPLDTFVVLFSADMGINNPYKGGEFVKNIMDNNNDQDILFINIGGGKTIEKRQSNWTIPYVSDPYEMALYYSSSDLYLYPTLADNCPLVVLEAMSCGLPILTFDTGGVPELVLHMETGYVASYESKEDLQKGFSLLIKNKELRNSMGINAMNRVHEKFTIEIMTENYLKLYTEIGCNKPKSE